MVAIRQQQYSHTRDQIFLALSHLNIVQAYNCIFFSTEYKGPWRKRQGFDSNFSC